MKSSRFVLWPLLLGMALLFMGCEENVYLFEPEPPPAMYGDWEASNPEAVGLDFISLEIQEDGHYRYFAAMDYFEMEELGHWDYDGHGDISFYSEYINGHVEETVYAAEFDLLDCDLLKVEYEDTDCQCPLYFERDCH
jgi:hypothetical protein